VPVQGDGDGVEVGLLDQDGVQPEVRRGVQVHEHEVESLHDEPVVREDRGPVDVRGKLHG